MKSLVSLLQRLKTINLTDIQPVVKNADDVFRLAKYFEKYGDDGVKLVEKMARKLKDFQLVIRDGNNLYGLSHSLNKHSLDWSKIGITTKDELREAINKSFNNGKKVLYEQYDSSGNFIGNRFGFYDEYRNIFIVTEEGGQLIMTFMPTNGWEYVKNLEYFFQI